ncbi:hypothetical protein PF010_g30756 [Phytophthora fragariae]|uniref:Uncharacterized protein n=1 Tax=Phytophthora fragariae TaxID=53985 RepID=A0A6A3DI04_9STRA|nr:hypothetical protein PF009_g31473 [Phytophthora fragariae]KAE9058531.1 hypothetical protein PF007_g31268 [Phytophthora fragariae]KAE9059090.1 hypothetical protein PF010_g30756 [Phytophthora fragariae]KAE9063589.1 hypothetical protein PF006_g30906 [Phytophthora fragariae]KAE9263936.1 hypothetical protein PF001_g31488 [Phytophthora fragariae]
MAGVFLPLVGVVANAYASVATGSSFSAVSVMCSGLSYRLYSRTRTPKTRNMT